MNKFSNTDDFNPDRPLTEKIGIQAWKYLSQFHNAIKTDKDMGFKYVNIGTWFYLDKNGMPNFDGEADRIEDALKQCEKLGLKPVINFNGQTNEKIDPNTHCYFNEAQLKHLKKEMSNIFQRFAGRGIIWGSYNEPNNVFWAKNDYNGDDRLLTQTYIDFQKWIIKETNAYDFNALNTVCGLIGLPYGKQNIYNQYKNLDAFKNANSVMTHLYIDAHEIPNQNPECLIDDDNIPQTNLPKTCNEFGYPIKGVPGEHWQGDLTYKEAAKRLKRQIIIQDYLNYAWMIIYCDANNAYRLIEEDGITLNPYGKAIKAFLAEMDGYKLYQKVNVLDSPKYSDDLYVFLYTKNDAPTKLLYWSPSNVGTQVINVNGANIKLKFTDDIQIIEPDLKPTQTEYFPDIKPDSSLGTRLI